MRTDNPVRDADNPVTDETFPSGAAAVLPLTRPSRRGALHGGREARRWLLGWKAIIESWCVLKDANFSRVKVPSG